MFEIYALKSEKFLFFPYFGLQIRNMIVYLRLHGKSGGFDDSLR